MLPVRIPGLVKALYGDLLWRMPAQEKALYLTFDDGPTRDVTAWVLDQLATHQALATFFLIGRNAHAEPELAARVRAAGHAIGNHTWQHVNGWRTATDAYLAEVDRTQELTGTRLFRPPYGRITRAQSKALMPRFDIIMWDVLSSDFDPRIDGARCARNVIRHARPGSIVVFHDSVKAWPRLKEALPVVLAHFAAAGYAFRPLPETGLRAAR